MRNIVAAFFVLLIGCPVAAAEFDVVETGIAELQQAMDRGEVTAVELVEHYLARIAAYDRQGPALNSVIRLNPRAREQAAALDAERARTGPRGPLHGIPILVKDNYNTTDLPTTGGSVALANFLPSQNATQVDRLLEAGAIILAKTNLHEYAYGITSVSSILGQTRNPYDIRRVPGGSSGGTGAGVAASFAAIGLGSDTCGSIRIPAAFNNLIGLRPTKGLSSIYGVMPLSHTQDVAGPLARNAEDLALLLDAVIGFDARDSATELMQTTERPRFHASLGTVTLDGLRFGRLTDYMDRASGPTRQLIDEALQWYEEQGVEIVELDMPDIPALIGRSGLIGHEFRIDLEQYLALFLSEDILNLNDIVDLGLYHEAVQGVLTRSRASVSNPQAYAEAMAARTELRTALEAIMAERGLDAMIYPPIADQPVFIGESQPGNNCSMSANSGLPALSLPVGFTDDGLPVGMELLGGFLDDARLLAIGERFEQAHATRQTPFVTPPLVEGAAPPAQRTTVNVAEQGLALSGWLELDRVQNTLRYSLSLNGADSADVAAVTLAIDDSEAGGDPVVLNLLGPQQDAATGSYFMTPAFRQAYLERRVLLRLFGADLGPAGLSVPLP